VKNTVFTGTTGNQHGDSSGTTPAFLRNLKVAGGQCLPELAINTSQRLPSNPVFVRLGPELVRCWFVEGTAELPWTWRKRVKAGIFTVNQRNVAKYSHLMLKYTQNKKVLKIKDFF